MSSQEGQYICGGKWDRDRGVVRSWGTWSEVEHEVLQLQRQQSRALRNLVKMTGQEPRFEKVHARNRSGNASVKVDKEDLRQRQPYVGWRRVNVGVKRSFKLTKVPPTAKERGPGWDVAKWLLAGEMDEGFGLGRPD